MAAPEDHYEDEAKQEWRKAQIEHEQLTDAGLDPNDPDVSELAPEGMNPDEDEQ